MSTRSTLQCLDESLKLHREEGHASDTQRHASDTHGLTNLKGFSLKCNFTSCSPEALLPSAPAACTTNRCRSRLHQLTCSAAHCYGCWLPQAA